MVLSRHTDSGQGAAGSPEAPRRKNGNVITGLSDTEAAGQGWLTTLGPRGGHCFFISLHSLPSTVLAT